MKKFIAVLVILLAATAVFADPIQLGTFPVGKWLDSNYDAVWDFASDNIRILGTDGKVLYDFSAKGISNFKISVDGIQPVITFTCAAAGRSYRLKASLPSTNVILEIERKDLPKYTVTMQKQ